jgi:hypothetical protein
LTKYGKKKKEKKKEKTRLFKLHLRVLKLLKRKKKQQFLRSWQYKLLLLRDCCNLMMKCGSRSISKLQKVSYYLTPLKLLKLFPILKLLPKNILNGTWLYRALLLLDRLNSHKLPKRTRRRKSPAAAANPRPAQYKQ